MGYKGSCGSYTGELLEKKAKRRRRKMLQRETYRMIEGIDVSTRTV